GSPAVYQQRRAPEPSGLQRRPAWGPRRLDVSALPQEPALELPRKGKGEAAALSRSSGTGLLQRDCGVVEASASRRLSGAWPALSHAVAGGATHAGQAA